MVYSSNADITGDNTAHPIGTAGQQARVLLLTATGGKARFGDASVSATQGVELPADVTVEIPCNPADRTDFIQLNQVHAYVPTSTTLTIAFGL